MYEENRKTNKARKDLNGNKGLASLVDASSGKLDMGDQIKDFKVGQYQPRPY